MALKEWFNGFRPIQLYLMLILTTIFFIIQLIMSHMTHALTLLVDSCHMLCNLIALAGCIITIKKSRVNLAAQEVAKEEIKEIKETEIALDPDQGVTAEVRERRLRNTFGWARIDVLVMLICCVFLASLCFSLVVEALQTLAHIDHHDEMHHAIAVLCVGVAGVLLHAICYLMIGGYTFHQGSFLQVTESGDVVVDQRSNQTGLSAFSQILRDVVGCLFVIVTSIIVYYTSESVAKYVDPVMAILSAVTLLVLSYPHMKESGFILLQTIPAHININKIQQQLLKEFPDIINVHELHIWQLTSSKIFSTAHIIFLNHQDYLRITQNITNFFYEQGITQVTIQPEFCKADITGASELVQLEDNECLILCPGELCSGQHCCLSSHPDLKSISVGHGHSHNGGSTHRKTVADNHSHQRHHSHHSHVNEKHSTA